MPLGAQEEFEAAPALVPGELTPRVVTRLDPEHSYALYLPSDYTPERRWPVLYLFEARRRGAAMAQVYQAAAERLGWILVSSNNAESDGDFEPNRRAMIAMWEDSHERFSIDPRRVYASGFSGGGRIAVVLAYVRQGEVAGVIGWGAGFPPTHKPVVERPSFAYYSAVGERDFNYYELVELGEQLAAAGARYRVRVFDGAHEWPPPAVAEEAMLWMELHAMKRGVRPLDVDLVEAAFAGRWQLAKGLEDAGRTYEAAAEYKQLQADFNGFHDVGAAEDLAIELAASSAWQRQAAAAEAVRKEESDYLERVKAAFNATASDATSPMTLPEVLAAMDLPELERRRDDTEDRLRALSAHRVMARLGSQTSFLLPRWMADQGDHRRALLMLEIGVRVQPTSNYAWWALARGALAVGDEKRTLSALAQAVELGFSDVTRLQDPAWDAMRDRPDFVQLLTRMAAPPPVG